MSYLTPCNTTVVGHFKRLEKYASLLSSKVPTCHVENGYEDRGLCPELNSSLLHGDLWLAALQSAHRNSEGECCRSAGFPNDSLPFAVVVGQHLIRNALSSVRWSNELIFRVSGQRSFDAFWSPSHISQTRAYYPWGLVSKKNTLHMRTKLESLSKLNERLTLKM